MAGALMTLKKFLERDHVDGKGNVITGTKTSTTELRDYPKDEKEHDAKVAAKIMGWEPDGKGGHNVP